MNWEEGLPLGGEEETVILVSDEDQKRISFRG